RAAWCGAGGPIGHGSSSGPERCLHRAAPLAGGDLPQVPLRLPRVRDGFAEAPVDRGDGAVTMPVAVATAAQGTPRADDVPGPAELPHRAGERDVPRSELFPRAAHARRAAPAHVPFAEGLGLVLERGRRSGLDSDPA